jgi:hypothetical protein
MQVAMNQDRPDLDTLAAVIVIWKVTNVFHSRRALALVFRCMHRQPAANRPHPQASP